MVVDVADVRHIRLEFIYHATKTPPCITRVNGVGSKTELADDACGLFEVDVRNEIGVENCRDAALIGHGK